MSTIPGPKIPNDNTKTRNTSAPADCLLDHLDYLAGTLGERPTGSENNLLAAAYIRETLADLGWDTHLQEFPFRQWIAQKPNLTCEGEAIDACANPYSPPCDLVAPLMPAGSIAELEQADLQGKILLAHGELTQEPLMPRNFRFYRHEPHCRIVQLIEGKGAAAVIAVSSREDQPVPVIIDGDIPVPSCTVTSEDGSKLLRSAGKLAALRICSQTRPVTASNVIGNSAHGEGKKVVICAHFDTKFYTPGALDNAAGVAVLLELARIFRKKPAKGPLELIFFNGEECYCAPGECTYLDAGCIDPAHVRLGINVDGSGLKGSPASISYFGCPEALVASAEHARAAFPAIVQMDPWPQGDHMIFFMNSIPCMAFSTRADPPIIDRIIHTCNDTLDRLDHETIRQVTGLVETIVRQAPGS